MNVLISDCDARASGFRDKQDCTVRAVASVFNLPYAQAHAKLATLGRKPGRGVSFAKIAPKLGLEIRPDLSCRTLASVLPELSTGRFVIRVRRHVFAVISGTVIDTFYPNPRQRTKMVYQLPL